MTTSPTVVVLAAGKGTRMRSSTPKVLHELCGAPMIAWPVRAALSAGSDRVVVVDSPARALARVLPEGVLVAIQDESHPAGTGGAVVAAAELLGPDSPVIVLSGDVPLVSSTAIEDLLRAHLESGALATMATTVLADPSGYGRVVRDPSGTFERVVETKEPGDANEGELEIHEVNTGIYAFDGAALLDALPRLRADNAQGELYLPQALDVIRSDGGLVAVHAVEDERLVLGVNDQVALARVRALAQQAICERHMLAGVTIVDPRSVQIDLDVQIAPDARVEPGSVLKGSTVVDECAVIGPGTSLIDSRVGRASRVGPHATVDSSTVGSGSEVRVSWLDQAVVEDGVSVGPFAYLRPGAVLHAGAKAGTFVEIKNSDVGANTKIPHLSYIGDADIGEGTNLGAGTITANYDGRSKHRTTIGSRVRGGVDTAFVAPVDVGDDAYTAAGSVVTEDVPPGALAVARARQENVEGYAERQRDET